MLAIRSPLYSTFLTNTAHISRIKLCQLWFRANPALLQFYVLCLIYSNQRISVPVAHMPTGRCALCPTLSGKCGAHEAVCAMSTVVPVKSCVFEVLHIQA
jgi:hypothetical protein